MALARAMSFALLIEFLRASLHSSGPMRQAFLLVFAICAISGSIISCDANIVDPSLSAETKRFNPPFVYQKWWAQTEACSGVKGDFNKVTWYDTPETTLYVDGEEASAYWSSGSNRIVITKYVELDGQVVRHEMLHALVKGKGHPREYFLGKCRGAVHCETKCIPDQQDLLPFASWLRVPPESLAVTVSLDPAQPSLEIDSGFFQVIVDVRNDRSRGVMVNLPVQVQGVAPYSFNASLVGPLGGPSDSRLSLDYSAVAFEPGETKREIFDYSLRATPQRSGLRTGHYRIFGKYGSVQKGPINVDLSTNITP